MGSRLRITITTYLLILFSCAILAPRADAGAKYKVLHNFGASGDGTLPYGPLAFDGEGNLYGVTFTGGTGQCSDYGCGTVFELTHRSSIWKETVLHSFTAANDGALPWGAIVFDGRGDPYGTLQGDNGLGGRGVFQLSRGSGGWANTLIYREYSGPGLLIDKLGTLCGAMGPGQYKYYGAMAELSPGSQGWNYTALYSFCSVFCPDGFSPPGPPIWDGKGNMFGTTAEGGVRQSPCWSTNGCGVAFEMSPNGDGTWSYNVLHRFASTPADGQSPNGSLAMNASGTFYGTTGRGGEKGNGTVFKLTFKGGQWKETVVYDFPNCSHGCAPWDALVFDKAGNLYGAASGGNTTCGLYYCGVIFKLTPEKNGDWKYSLVHRFHGPDGNFPLGVILDGKGNIFGVTENGGTYNTGVAFEVTP
jgi:uncharacterized repeat protein (TIGR03803 family)